MAGNSRQLLKKKAKIFYLVTEDWYFCSHRLPIACATRDRGYNVVVATRVQKYAEQITQEGFKLIPISLRRSSKNPLKEICSILELIKIYRIERPDVVHHVAMKPVLYGTIAARIAHVPSVVNAFAGMGYAFTSSKWQVKLLKTAMRFIFKFILNASSSRVIVQNPDDIRMLEIIGVKRDFMVLIRGSGVDTMRFSPTPEADGVPMVVMASRMLRDKGVKEFVEAAGYLKNNGINARFVLVGSPDQDNPSSIAISQLHEWHNSGVVEWWGHRDDMPVVFAQSHIVCLPSYREGLPKVLIEAAACGRPVITTDVPGCREVVQNGRNGLLVPARDSIKLAEAIRQLIENPVLRREMGKKNREIAETEFSVEKVISQTIALYQELTA